MSKAECVVEFGTGEVEIRVRDENIRLTVWGPDANASAVASGPEVLRKLSKALNQAADFMETGREFS